MTSDRTLGSNPKGMDMSVVRRALGTGFLVVGMTLLGPATMGTAGAVLPPVSDKDCTDFRYQEDAQALFDAIPGDPHKLDADGDKIACENLPSRPIVANPPGNTTTTTTPAAPAAPAVPAVKTDKDCADFATQAAAQAELAKDPRDPHGLDADHDGYACESKFGKPGSGNQVKVKPSGGVETGGGTTGADPGLLTGFGALLLTGASAGAVLISRRRSRR